MDQARIAELLQPFLRPANTLSPCHSESGQKPGEEPAVLSSAQLEHISTYIDILLRWNARINLTAIRNPEEIVQRHFGESLFAARHLFQGLSGDSDAEKYVGPGLRPGQAERGSAALTVADVGSGAGFPGLPVKLWAPHISLALIESNQKKATFLREVTRALTLTDVNIQNARAETLTGASFDVVTLRAVEHFESILPAAAALVAPGGRLAVLIGAAQLAQARSLVPHFSWTDPQPVPFSHSRVLAIAHRSQAMHYARNQIIQQVGR